jgi:2-hydroxy-6-oxo-6-(2'-aminophenyl)hexa-2,4-dienoate hydrolase
VQGRKKMLTVPPNIQENYTKANGIKTHYWEAGKGEALILMHGGGAGADAWGNWKGSISRFAENFRVFALDMLGFGKTERPDPAAFVYSQDARTKHLIAFIEALSLKPASLVGNSMGGATSLGVSMERPDLVKKLVLMGSAGLNTEISEAIRVILSYSPTRENMRKLVSVLTNPAFQVDEELIEYRYNQTQQPGAMAALGAAMKWIAEQGGLYYDEGEISRVKTPTLIIGGKEDKVVPPEIAWKFTRLLENSWLYLIPHCGHWAMMERPQEFHAVTTNFLLYN